MRDIVKDLDKLSDRADEVDIRKQNKLIRDTIIELKEIIREKNLTYLTAPQIDVPIKVFVINFNGNLRSFVNPIISETNGFELSREKCNSLDSEYIRPRANTVSVIYQTPLGKIESRKMLGKAAIVFQHALDHLDGLLLSDVGLEITEDFDKASEDDKAELIKMYIDSLDIKRKELEKEIEGDKDLKQVSDAIDFLESVKKGETDASIIENKKEIEK
jgi:peptide deformylase